MYNTLIISTIMNVVPLLAVTFVVVLMLHKVYIRIRSRYDIKVNCWFCNENTKVAYEDRNSWTCPKCEQYNGFTRDGDYNREIYQQLDCRNLNQSNRSCDDCSENELISYNNGFCNTCNEAQRMKVEKLAQFEPKYELNFDSELKKYKAKLEDQYRLCATCDRHLKRVLHEKKKMVLGSKFLQFVLQGANMLKQPHLVQKQHQLIWKQRITMYILILSLVNIGCLSWNLTIPEISLKRLTNIFGNFLGLKLFYLLSHSIAFIRVLRTCIITLCEEGVALKLRLFCRTIFLMLIYSLGLKLPQVMRVNLSALLLLISPYTVLTLAFVYNMVDNFRLSRHTLLLGIWGIVSADFIGEAWLGKDTILVLTSLFTVGLIVWSGKENCAARTLNDTTQSLHRLYAEDYTSEYDDDTLSLLSQQLNSSTVSQRSSNYTMKRQNLLNGTNLNKSSFTDSIHSLGNRSKMHNTSLNSSFQHNKYANNILHTPYAASVCSIGSQTSRAMPTYASSIDLRARNNFSNNHNNNNINGSLRKLRTPFSASTSTVYGEEQTAQQQQQQRLGGNLLSPSRFGSNFYNTPTYYYNNGNNINNMTKPAQMQRFNVGNVLYEARCMENMSRSSSHSSGFESQSNENLIYGNEHGCGRDSVFRDLNSTTYLDQNYQAGFKPVMERPSRPYIDNCEPRVADIFNFQHFDAQLPNYRRGDLLRKWKDTQVIT